jgi:trimeric autotransporter adhesin
LLIGLIPVRGIQRNTFIAGISGVTVAGGIGIIVDSSGHLGTSTSSARYKENIQPMDKASEAILALKPVTFQYKKELDPSGIPQFGLVAEQVEKVNPDLVARDDEGKPYSVRYEAVNAMLLNEFLKEHRKVQELEANAAQQQKEIKALTASLKEQASQIQKVSAQLAAASPSRGGLKARKSSPQIVLNNQ